MERLSDAEVAFRLWFFGGLLAAVYFYVYGWPVIDSFRHGREHCLKFWKRVGWRFLIGTLVMTGGAFIVAVIRSLGR